MDRAARILQAEPCMITVDHKTYWFKLLFLVFLYSYIVSNSCISDNKDFSDSDELLSSTMKYNRNRKLWVVWVFFLDTRPESLDRIKPRHLWLPYWRVCEATTKPQKRLLLLLPYMNIITCIQQLDSIVLGVNPSIT